MKGILVAILAVGLCGCQGLKQGGATQQQGPAAGTMATGNWEFVLQKTDSENIYVESNIASTNTAGTYNQSGASTVFSLDSDVYYEDPDAGGGYTLGSAVTGFTLTINSQLGVSGTLNQTGGQSIRFTGMVDSTGTTMTGTFDDGSGSSAPFTASSTTSTLGGNFIDSTGTIRESISGSLMTETSPNGGGNYQLKPTVGNFAFLTSDVPVGGDGSVVFWNNSGVCSGKQCAVWIDTYYGTMWILMNDPSSGATQVISTLRPPA